MYGTLAQCANARPIGCHKIFCMTDMYARCFCTMFSTPDVKMMDERKLSLKPTGMGIKLKKKWWDNVKSSFSITQTFY